MPCPMAGSEDYRQASAPAGSSVYYASLFVDPARRPQVQALHALADELQRSRAVQDPGVARLRLQWWHEEIRQAEAGAARHPITRELQAQLQDGRLDGSLLIRVISGIEAELTATDNAGFETILDQYGRHFGLLWRLSAGMCDVNDARALKAVEQLGGLHQLGRDLQSLPQNLQRGCSRPVPRQELEAAGLSPEDTRSQRVARAWRALLDRQLQRLVQRLEQVIGEFPAQAAAPAIHCLILARLDAVLWTEIRVDGCKVFDQQYALTPVRKLWLAWRTWRKATRNAAQIPP